MLTRIRIIQSDLVNLDDCLFDDFLFRWLFVFAWWLGYLSFAWLNVCVFVVLGCLLFALLTGWLLSCLADDRLTDWLAAELSG